MYFFEVVIISLSSEMIGRAFLPLASFPMTRKIIKLFIHSKLFVNSLSTLKRQSFYKHFIVLSKNVLLPVFSFYIFLFEATQRAEGNGRPEVRQP